MFRFLFNILSVSMGIGLGLGLSFGQQVGESGPPEGGAGAIQYSLWFLNNS
jgi:hypothetical protein